MKTETRLILGALVFVLISVFVIYINYMKDYKNYERFIDDTIYSVIEQVKFNIDTTDKVIDDIFNIKKNMFKNIHEQAIRIYKQNPAITPKQLHKILTNTSNDNNLKIDLYFINEDYIIYDTTYKPDFNLNMSKFIGAKETIDMANKSNQIIVMPPSVDIATKEFRTYSYGTLDRKNKILLEIGFFDDSISNLKKLMYQNSLQNNMVESIELFGNFQNYIVNITQTDDIKFKSKNDFLDYLTKHKNSKENSIINKVSQSEDTISYTEVKNGKTYEVFYTSIKHINISKTKYTNYVIKIVFDITQQKHQLDKSQKYFYYSIVLLALLFIIFLLYLKKNIFNPLNVEIEKQNKKLKILNENLEKKVQQQVNETISYTQRFETIFDTVKDGIAILDSNSNFLLVNDAYSKITGLTKDELYKTSCIALTSTEYIEPSIEAMEKVNSQGFCYGFEKECLFGNKKIEIVMDFVKMPHTNNIIAVTKDVTHLKQKEKKMLEQSRLAQMGEMISMIAHQWRQPLGAISSSIVSIQNKLALGKFDLSNEEDRKLFEKFLSSKMNSIEKYLDFLSITIDEFRDFYKKDKIKSTLSTTDIVYETLKIIKTSLTNKNIQIGLELNDNNKIEIYKNELMQVVLNIIKNSEDNFQDLDKNIKTITISTKAVEENHIITIKDNGGGIDEEILPNIFKPYFSTKEDKNGTGLGLYMSKTIIEDHHSGKLYAKNIYDGVEFTIVLKGS
jgi:PAS domain S-box-containing protein